MKDEDVIVIEQPKLGALERLYIPQIIGGLAVTMRHMLSVPAITVQYPEEKREVRVENYRGVHRLNKETYVNAEGETSERVACVACYMCSTACPAHCIHIEAAESPWDDREKYPAKFDIDELRCIYCGMCEEACPVDAIELTPHYELVGRTRDEMVFDKAKLLDVFDRTKDEKPRKEPRITGYPGTGGPDAVHTQIGISEH
ncbi:MAG: NADH-quinone oxidoreductase subunit I [Planctomycetes bacterium]|nr:NADH-quinone oxidoreductase subunit I [Planctomycetota bacterium]